MRKSINMLLAGLCVCFIFYLVASGCTWVTFTAQDHLKDKIALKSNNPVKSIYLTCLSSGGGQGKAGEVLAARIKIALEANGYTLLPSADGADLILRLKYSYFNKRSGTQYFFLGVIPTAGLEGGVHKVEGLKVNAEYATDRGKWNKTYVAYYSQANMGNISFAIVSDLKIISYN